MAGFEAPQYGNAPVSEVFIGVGYMRPRILVDAVLKKALLSENYPNLEIAPPLNVELLDGYSLLQVMVPDGGQFLVRRWNVDRKWLVQIQANALYVNWSRPDEEPPSGYVGFDAVRGRFFGALSALEGSCGSELQDGVSFMELSYTDRFPWQPEIANLGHLDRIMNIGLPPKFSDEGYNNCFAHFPFHDAEIGGFGTISVNTATGGKGEQLLAVETKLHGRPEDGMAEWLERAREKQHRIFKGLFKTEMREKWL